MENEKSPSASAADISNAGTLTVTEPAMAAALMNPKTLRQLEPFLGRERTVLEAAQEAGVKPNTMLARVQRFLALGLLVVVRERPRGGRAIKVYTGCAASFFVPYEITSAETLGAAMRERERYWEELLRKNVVRVRSEDVGSWGTRIYRDARGRLQVQAAVTPEQNYTLLAPERPAALSAWRDALYLDYDDAKALQQELFSLLKRYQAKTGVQRYILHVGLAPILK
jgi:hypothetical protein